MWGGWRGWEGVGNSNRGWSEAARIFKPTHSIVLQSISRRKSLIMKREHFHGRVEDLWIKMSFSVCLQRKDIFVDKYFMWGEIKNRVSVCSCRTDNLVDVCHKGWRLNTWKLLIHWIERVIRLVFAFPSSPVKTTTRTTLMMFLLGRRAKQILLYSWHSALLLLSNILFLAFNVNIFTVLMLISFRSRS